MQSSLAMKENKNSTFKYWITPWIFHLYWNVAGIFYFPYFYPKQSSLNLKFSVLE